MLRVTSGPFVMCEGQKTFNVYAGSVIKNSVEYLWGENLKKKHLKPLLPLCCGAYVYINERTEKMMGFSPT